MEEINLKELGRYFVSKIYILFIIIAVILLVGNIHLIFFKTPLYKSDTTLLLIANEGDVNSSNAVALINNLVPTYTELMKSRKVLSTVIETLQLDESVGDLSSQVNVSSITGTQIIKIEVSNKDGRNAMRIANELAKIFMKEIKEKYGFENITVIDEAKEASLPYNINIPKQNIIYLLISLVLGISIIFVLFYFDTSIKDAKMVEDKFNLTVLGSVPKVGDKND